MKVKITSPFIRLDALLKLSGAVITGGQAKLAVQYGQVFLNGEVCLMRGKKLTPGDKITYQDKEIEVCCEG